MAVLRYTLQFDKASSETLQVPAADFKEAERTLPPALKQAILTARENITTFDSRQPPLKLLRPCPAFNAGAKA